MTKDQATMNQQNLEDLADKYGENSPQVQGFIKTMAKNQAGATEAQAIRGKEELNKMVDDIQSDLRDYEANG